MNITVKTGPRRNPGRAGPGEPQPRPARPGRPGAPDGGPARPAPPAARSAASPAAVASRTVARPAAVAARTATRPAAGPAARTGPARPPGPARQAGETGRRAASRTPFILLVLGLLGGGLICLLVINTTLAAASFRISALQQGNTQASQRVEELQQQVAAEQSPASIEQRALKLGLRMQPVLDFVDLRTGRSYVTPATVPGVVSAPPGYTP
jgi:hypothetical protein